jgi:hypothetical protein
MIIEWKKDCKCNATATKPGFTFTQQEGPRMEIQCVVTFHPGPVCDGCGKPWRIIREGTSNGDMPNKVIGS